MRGTLFITEWEWVAGRGLGERLFCTWEAAMVVAASRAGVVRNSAEKSTGGRVVYRMGMAAGREVGEGS